MIPSLHLHFASCPFTRSSPSAVFINILLEMSNASEVFDGAWYPNSRTSARSGYGDTGAPFALVHEHPLGSEHYPILIHSDDEDFIAGERVESSYITRIVELPQLHLFRRRLRALAARAQYQRNRRSRGARRNGHPVVLEFRNVERELEALIDGSFEIQMAY